MYLLLEQPHPAKSFYEILAERTMELAGIRSMEIYLEDQACDGGTSLCHRSSLNAFAF